LASFDVMASQLQQSVSIKECARSSCDGGGVDVRFDHALPFSSRVNINNLMCKGKLGIDLRLQSTNPPLQILTSQNVACSIVLCNRKLSMLLSWLFHGRARKDPMFSIIMSLLHHYFGT
jgi:hypothetical protein